MRDVARHADAGPWESVWVYDHFHTVPRPTDEACHEAWTLMAALGATTERVRLGQMCTCMSYRNPAYLAKVAATCDIVSGGRVEMGIGGGWYEHEWRAYGYGFPSAGVRLGMLDEGVQIMRQAWTEGRATLHGKHYQVDGAIVPAAAAAGGRHPAVDRRRRREGDAQDRGEVRAVHELRRHARRASPASPSCSPGTAATSAPTSTRSSAPPTTTSRSARPRPRSRTGCSSSRPGSRPFVGAERAEGQLGGFRGLPACGTPEQIVENLRKLEAAGMTYGIFYFPEAAYDRSGIELFEREVVPALR